MWYIKKTLNVIDWANYKLIHCVICLKICISIQNAITFVSCKTQIDVESETEINCIQIVNKRNNSYRQRQTQTNRKKNNVKIQSYIETECSHQLIYVMVIHYVKTIKNDYEM